MLVDGRPYRTIWRDPDNGDVLVIDQRRLPFEFSIKRLTNCAGMAEAICNMTVRGAGLIGASAAYGMALAAREHPDEAGFREAAAQLMATRPTAVNLEWAVQRILHASTGVSMEDRCRIADELSGRIADEDARFCKAIGEHGLALIRRCAEKRNGEPVRILTHCNAGWLAFVDYGSATSPIYAAHDTGLPVHVWVQETRPRSQGARLTAWELTRHGVPCSVIVDNAGGHVMQRGMVDLVLTGTDRTTATGDVCNKIGTYPTALAAKDNGIPFHVALPSSSIDWTLSRGLDIPIEERDATEVTHVETAQGPAAFMEPTLPVRNYAFDVTPAELVSGLITERGLCPASRAGLAALFPEHA